MNKTTLFFLFTSLLIFGCNHKINVETAKKIALQNLKTNTILNSSEVYLEKNNPQGGWRKASFKKYEYTKIIIPCYFVIFNNPYFKDFSLSNQCPKLFNSLVDLELIEFSYTNKENLVDQYMGRLYYVLFNSGYFSRLEIEGLVRPHFANLQILEQIDLDGDGEKELTIIPVSYNFGGIVVVSRTEEKIKVMACNPTNDIPGHGNYYFHSNRIVYKYQTRRYFNGYTNLDNSLFENWIGMDYVVSYKYFSNSLSLEMDTKNLIETRNRYKKPN